MPIARVQMPDGSIGRFEVPEGTTPQEVEKFAFEQVNAKPAPPEPSTMDRAGRVAGLGARAVVRGATAIPGLMADAASEAVNLGIEGANKLGANIDYRMQKPTTVLDRAMTDAGVSAPANAAERTATDVASAMVGAALPAKIADWVAGVAQSPFAKQIAETLAKNLGLQVVSAGTGTASGDIARENGAGPVGQTVATVAGSLAPAVAQTAASGAVRSVMRGGESGRKAVEDNIKTFADAGTTPTVGQATEMRGPWLAETMLSKTPGSAGVMANKATTQAAQMGGKVDELAGTLSTNTGAENAGRAIKEGITADKGFKSWFRARQGALYGELDKYIPSTEKVSADNTLARLKELTTPIRGAENTSAAIQQPRIATLAEAFTEDAAPRAERIKPGVPVGATSHHGVPIPPSLLGPDGKPLPTIIPAKDGGIPYEALKQLRTAVGQKISNPSLVDDITTGQWKALYGALSEDMKVAAEKSGPDALRAWGRANDFTKAGIQRLETLDTVIGTRDPEDIFKAAISGTQEGATTLRAVVKSLPEPAQKSVAATVLKRLGMATPGRQNELGEIFSTESFLTNWNKLSGEAKLTLFSKYGPDFTKNLDQIAKAASNLRDGSKVFANPSGTEAAVTTRLGLSGIILSTLLGHPGTAAAIGGGMGAANVGARQLMTNPEFVRWLAQTTKMPGGSLQGSIASLESLARNQRGDSQAAMFDLADALKTGSGTQ